MGEYYRRYEFSQELSSGGGSKWEAPDGTIHTIPAQEKLVGMKVKKSFYQDSPVMPVKVGENFTIKKEFGDTVFGTAYTWDTLTVLCQSIVVSDEVVSNNGANLARLWKVDLSGVVVGSGGSDTDQGDTLRREESESRELNGSVETAVDGTTVILRRSKTPRTTRSISVYGESLSCPVTVGGLYEGGTVTSTRSSRQDILSGGVLVKTLYRYDIEVVY